MNFEKQMKMLEECSAMTLRDLCDLVVESEMDMLNNDNFNFDKCLVFFQHENGFFDRVKVELRYNSEHNRYILVFDMK